MPVRVTRPSYDCAPHVLPRDHYENAGLTTTGDRLRADAGRRAADSRIPTRRAAPESRRSEKKARRGLEEVSGFGEGEDGYGKGETGRFICHSDRNVFSSRGGESGSES